MPQRTRAPNYEDDVGTAAMALIEGEQSNWLLARLTYENTRSGGGTRASDWPVSMDRWCADVRRESGRKFSESTGKAYKAVWAKYGVDSSGSDESVSFAEALREVRPDSHGSRKKGDGKRISRRYEREAELDVERAYRIEKDEPSEPETEPDGSQVAADRLRSEAMTPSEAESEAMTGTITIDGADISIVHRHAKEEHPSAIARDVTATIQQFVMELRLKLSSLHVWPYLQDDRISSYLDDARNTLDAVESLVTRASAAGPDTALATN